MVLIINNSRIKAVECDNFLEIKNRNAINFLENLRNSNEYAINYKIDIPYQSNDLKLSGIYGGCFIMIKNNVDKKAGHIYYDYIETI